MGSDKETVFQVGYYRVESLKKGELGARLSELHKKLATLGQDDRPRGLNDISTLLVTKSFLNHSDREMKLLVLCCLVDIFRIYAPEAPLSDEDAVHVFDCIVGQIRGLLTHSADSTTGIKLTYLINSLATVKSCVVPVLLYHAGVEGAQEVVHNLFEALLASVHAEHPENLLENICSILEFCIEELGEIDTEILETLLTTLLPAAKTENPVAYKVVEYVLKRVCGSIEPSLSKYVNHILVGSSIGDSADIVENIYPIIYELHKLSPDMLNHILPNVCSQLATEEEDVRLKVVKLVGRLFASKHASYAKDFHRDFLEFLFRFSDVSVAIRLEMLEIGFLLLDRQPQQFSLVEDYITKRLRDPDTKVRLTTLHKLLDIATTNISMLKTFTIEEIAFRVKDKKPEIVSVALVGISKLYSKHLSSKLSPIDEIFSFKNASRHRSADSSASHSKGKSMSENLVQTIPPDVLSRCSFIPGMVINCWGYPDTSTKHLVLQMLQEQLLPKVIRSAMDETSSEGGSGHKSKDSGKNSSKLGNTQTSSSKTDEIDKVRATSLLFLFYNLSSPERGALGSILGFKTKIRLGVNHMLEAINKLQSQSTARSSESSKRKKMSSKGNKTDISSMLNDSAATEEEDEDSDLMLPFKRNAQLLLQWLPPTDKKIPALEELLHFKDKHIIRLFNRCVVAEDSIQQHIKSRDDMAQRLDSKSLLSQYCALLFDVSAFLFTNCGMVQALLDYVQQAITLHMWTNESCDAESELLLLLAKHIAPAYKGSSLHLHHLLQAVIADSGERNMLPLLQSLSMIAKHVASVICGDSDVKLLCETQASLLFTCKDIEICEIVTESLLRIELYQTHQQQEWNETEREKNEDIPSQVVINLIKDFVSEKNLSITNSRLPFNLRILATFFRVPSAIALTIDFMRPFVSLLSPVFDDLKEQITAFLLQNVVTESYIKSVGESFTLQRSPQTQKAAKKAASNNQTKTEHIVDEKIDNICAALVLWTSLVGTEEEIRQWMQAKYRVNYHVYDDQSMLSNGLDEERENSNVVKSNQAVQETVEVLFSCLYTDGKKIGQVEVVSDEITQGKKEEEALVKKCVKIAETSTLCLLSLLKLKVIGATMPIEHWKRLAWKFLDARPAFKTQLVETFSTIIQIHAIHPRFLAYQCLLATDDQFSKHADSVFLFAMKRLRATYENLSSRVLSYSALLANEGARSSTNNKQGQDNLMYVKQIALMNMPETVLPYVLYLLSYHPDFPVSATLDGDSDRRKVQRIIACLKFVVSNLMASLKRDANNISYLLKQVNTLVQHYVDRIDSGNIGLHFVSRLTIQLLKAQIRTVDNALIFPGAIHLPMDLFRHAKTLPKQSHQQWQQQQEQQQEHEELMLMMVENNQDTFEKVFNEKVIQSKAGNSNVNGNINNNNNSKSRRLMMLSPAKVTKSRRAVKYSPGIVDVGAGATSKKQRRVKGALSSKKDRDIGSDEENDDSDNDDGYEKEEASDGEANNNESEDQKVSGSLKTLTKQQQGRPRRVAARGKIDYRDLVDNEVENEVEHWEKQAQLAQNEKRRLSQQQKQRQPDQFLQEVLMIPQRVSELSSATTKVLRHPNGTKENNENMELKGSRNVGNSSGESKKRRV